jgi:hypothetical protein
MANAATMPSVIRSLIKFRDSFIFPPNYEILIPREIITTMLEQDDNPFARYLEGHFHCRVDELLERDGKHVRRGANRFGAK